MPTLEEFLADPRGGRFQSVIGDPRLEGGFGPIATFFDDPERIRRMEESEIHHNRPALAGVIKEFEAQPAVQQFFIRSLDIPSTADFRNAVGLLVRMAMAGKGWQATGKKGSLGRRIYSGDHRFTDSGLPYNTPESLSKWFRASERFTRPEGLPLRDHVGWEALRRREARTFLKELADQGDEEEQRENLRVILEGLARRHAPTEQPSS